MGSSNDTARRIAPGLIHAPVGGRLVGRDPQKSVAIRRLQHADLAIFLRITLNSCPFGSDWRRRRLGRVSVEFEYLGLKDHPPRRVEYHEAWEHQREVHARVASGETGNQVIFVEHDPVYTAGRQTKPHERPFDGTPVVDVDRGGNITWHGPGQLVGYPIVQLPDRVGVVDHVRRVEQAVIDVLASYGILAGRVPGRTGVWLPADDPSTVPLVEPGRHHRAGDTDRTGNFTFDAPAVAAPATGGLQLASVEGQAPAVGQAMGGAERSGHGPSVRGPFDDARSAGGSRGVGPPRQGMRPERKICAIGIRVTKRTTLHGFSINVSNTLDGFDNIVPCGISDAGVTTMAAEMDGPPPTLVELAERLEPLLAAHLSREGNLKK